MSSDMKIISDKGEKIIFIHKFDILRNYRQGHKILGD